MGTQGKKDGSKAEGRVFLKRDPAGGWRKFWYGRWMANGKSRETSLCPYQGTPPANPAKEEGNPAFERSRERARGLLVEAVAKWEGTASEERDAQKVFSIRYGRKARSVKLAELAEKWDDLPHKADLSAERRERVHSVLKRFVDFMGDHFPTVTDAAALTAEHFRGFLADVEESGLSARSWNDHLSILRGVLARVDGQSKGFRDYLAHLPKKEEGTVHRRPFTGAELEEIFTAAREVDPELFPVIVAAACTALRRGDVCRLRWDAVDMGEGFAAVKTTKTLETVDLPIFPPFMAVLREAAKKKNAGVPYVWPEIAAAYEKSPDALDRRLRRVLEKAGFVPPDREKVGKYPAPSSPGAAVAAVDAGMRSAGWSEARREKGLAILQRHLLGMQGKDIAAAMGIARGAVSVYLHALEEVGQVALVSPPKADDDAPRRKATLAEMKEGETRARRGSLSAWHSFRTTFCTLALSHGVPMDLLRKITGHRTAEIVLKHYDRRGRAAMKAAIGAAMPKAIAGAVARSGEAVAEKVPAAGAADGPVELEAVPGDVAALARELLAADPAKLAAVREMLAGA